VKHADNGWVCEVRKAHILSFSTALIIARMKAIILFHFILNEVVI